MIKFIDTLCIRVLLSWILQQTIIVQPHRIAQVAGNYTGICGKYKPVHVDYLNSSVFYSSVKMNKGKAEDCDLTYCVAYEDTNSVNEYEELKKRTHNSNSVNQYKALEKGTQNPASEYTGLDKKTAKNKKIHKDHILMTGLL